MSELDRKFTLKIIEQDSVLYEKATNAQEAGDYDTVFKTMQERYSLYSQAQKWIQTEGYRLFFTTTMKHINGQIALIWITQQYDGQIARIISRLDELETKVKDLEKKSSDHNHS